MIRIDKFKNGFYIAVCLAMLIMTSGLAFTPGYTTGVFFSVSFLAALLVISGDMLFPGAAESYRGARKLFIISFALRFAASVLAGVCACAVIESELVIELAAIVVMALALVTDVIGFMYVRKHYVKTDVMEWTDLHILTQDEMDNEPYLRAARRLSRPIFFYLLAGFLLLSAVSVTFDHLFGSLASQGRALMIGTAVLSGFFIVRSTMLLVKRAWVMNTKTPAKRTYWLVREAVFAFFTWYFIAANFVLAWFGEEFLVAAILIDIFMILHMVFTSFYIKSRLLEIEDKTRMLKMARPDKRAVVNGVVVEDAIKQLKDKKVKRHKGEKHR